MFPSLAPVLGWNLETPADKAVLITDELQAEGSFLLQHFIGMALKRKRKVCILGLAHSKVHYKFIAKKMGNGSQADKIAFIDCISRLLSDGGSDTAPSTAATGAGVAVTTASSPSSSFSKKPPSSNRAAAAAAPTASDPTFTLDLKAIDPLASLYTCICKQLGVINGVPLPHSTLVIDDVSLLLDLGIPMANVIMFLRKCRALMRRGKTPDQRGCFVMLCHREQEEDAEEDRLIPASESLSAHLPFLTEVHLSVERLHSGYSRDVHGQLTVTAVEASTAIPAKSVLQYKIRDQGVDFFAPGTSKAVL